MRLSWREHESARRHEPFAAPGGRDAGIEAAHWSTIGAKNATAAQIMAFAAANDFVIPTHDLDIGSILGATRGNEPSAVQVHGQDVSPDAVGRSVIDALRQMATALDEGCLLTVDPARTRVRVLPLPRA